jgi:hypothetical protein
LRIFNLDREKLWIINILLFCSILRQTLQVSSKSKKIQMKSKLSTILPKSFSNALIGCTLLTLLTPTSLLAQVGSNLSDAEYLAKYGTSRRQQTCPSRTEPLTGPISVAQAMKYAICEVEGDSERRSLGDLFFLDIYSLQVGPPRRAKVKETANYELLDESQPVYDLKGRAVKYGCSSIIRPAGHPEYGKTCITWGSRDSDSINSSGFCFKALGGKWRCKLNPVTAKFERLQSPPK